jgi:putative acetyltransferase
MTIRPERPDDIARVREINTLAFGQPAEALLVDTLRANCADAVSLVADENAVVGHILFTPVTVENSDRPLLGMGLAPMAVHPDRQRAGIGTQLVTRGLEILRERNCPFVVVVGHPEYYPRFGFVPASRRGLVSQWAVPDDAFMVLVLDEPAMAGMSGVARYRAEFDDAT